jgi:hypothetical protein
MKRVVTEPGKLRRAQDQDQGDPPPSRLRNTGLVYCQVMLASGVKRPTAAIPESAIAPLQNSTSPAATPTNQLKPTGRPPTFGLRIRRHSLGNRHRYEPTTPRRTCSRTSPLQTADNPPHRSRPSKSVPITAAFGIPISLAPLVTERQQGVTTTPLRDWLEDA